MSKLLPVVFVGLLLFQPAACRADVEIVKDGRASAVVVIPDNPSPTAEYAAAELVWHIKRATGAELPVARESEIPAGYGSRVYVGPTEAAVYKAGIKADALGKEETALFSRGPEIYVLGKESEGQAPLSHGNSYSGTLFGIYEILERYVGVVWAWPGELGTYIPSRDEILIESGLDERFKPGLTWRILLWSRVLHKMRGWRDYDPDLERLAFSREGLESYGSDLEVYLRRHRQGRSEPVPSTGHRFSGWWEKYGDSHPEWFMLNEQGVRGPLPGGSAREVEPCVSNPDFHDYIIEKWDGESDINLSGVDAGWICLCDKCAEWDGPQPDEEDLPYFLYHEGVSYYVPRAASDRYARFWGKIHGRAAEQNPDVRVTTYVSKNYFPAPKEFKELGPGVFGEVHPWGNPHLHWFPVTGEGALEWLKEQWEGWYKTGITMMYRPNYLHDGWIMPHVETRQSIEFFKFAHKNGMSGARFDSLCGQWAAQGPKLYMHSRMMAKPELGREKILDEYYSVFGPAEAEVREYFGYWEEYAYDNKERFIDIYRDVGNRWRRFQLKAHEAYPPESFGPAEEILARAHAAAGADPNPEYLERVRFLKLGLEHAKIGARLAAQFDGRRNIPRDSVRFGRAKRVLNELLDFRREHEKLNICDYVSNAFKENIFWNLDPFFE